MSEPAHFEFTKLFQSINYRPYKIKDRRCECCRFCVENKEDEIDECINFDRRFCPDQYYVCDEFKEA